MLKTYFVKPQTLDRIRACWIGAEIERCAGWLAERGYSTRKVLRRVPALVASGTSPGCAAPRCRPTCPLTSMISSLSGCPSPAVPGFFEYLADERGLRPESIVSYWHHLACFEAYLDHIGVADLAELSPEILSAFVAERTGAGLAKTTVRSGCGVPRVFLRYAHRQGPLAADLSKAVEWPTAY